MLAIFELTEYHLCVLMYQERDKDGTRNLSQTLFSMRLSNSLHCNTIDNRLSFFLRVLTLEALKLLKY